MSVVKFRRHLYTREEALATTWPTRKNTFYAVANSVEGASPKYILRDGVSSLAQLVTTDEFLGEDYAGVGGYSEWVGTLTQTGTNAPVATVLQNGLGGTLVWARLAEGIYSGTLVGAFPSGRVVVNINLGQATVTRDARILRGSDDAVAIYTYESDAAADGMLTAAMVTIRVYPS